MLIEKRHFHLQWHQRSVLITTLNSERILTKKDIHVTTTQKFQSPSEHFSLEVFNDFI